MDYQALLKKLIEAGMTQESIGLSLGVSQATISRLMSGQIGEPKASSGKKLELLARERGIL